MTDPPVGGAVARVAVSPASAAIDPGRNRQFVATAFDSGDEPVAGATFVWDVDDPDVATVDDNGLVTGLVPGRVTVRATVADRSGAATLEVRAVPSGLSISAISPTELIEGEPATIAGSGFSTLPVANLVTIGGVKAEVKSATDNRLEIVVPTICAPEGDVMVEVAYGSRRSGPVPHPIRPSGSLELGVGEMTILRSPDDLCLQFSASGANEEYLVGVQSVSEVPSSLTAAKVSARSAAGPSGARAPRVPAPAGRAIGTARAPGLDRLARHREAEIELRRRERALVSSGVVSPNRIRALSSRSALEPANAPSVGDQLEVRVPSRSDLCNDFTPISTTVRHVGQRAVWVTDDANPAGGFDAATFDELAGAFDRDVFPELVGTFGAPTDLDGNDRIVIVITQELNRTFAQSPILGFVVLSDLVGRSTCPSSNEGEFFYAIAPDPGAAHGTPFPTAEVIDLTTPLVAHEATHVIQFGRRASFSGATGFLSSWQAEGQATLAEEVVGFRMRGRRTGRNYGSDVVFDESGHNWHLEAFFDLFTYFGLRSPTARVSDAPERCSFLGRPDEGNSSPCVGRMVYGVSWSFLRWITDRFGPLHPDGEAGIQRAIIDNASTGFETIEDVTGAPIEELLAGWAAALYLDDRLAVADPGLGFASWNLADIDRNAVETARLLPRERGFAPFEETVFVRAGSSAYFLIGAAGRPATAIRVRDGINRPLPETMQLWVVRTR